MKKYHFFPTLAIFLLLIVNFQDMKAQEGIDLMENAGDNRGWNISAAVGTSVFLGDIKTNPLLPALRDLSELRYVALLGGERRFNPWIAARLHFAYSHVLGTRKPWDVHFQSFVWESGLTGLLYPVNLFSGYSDTRFADFYIVAGLGLLNYNTTLYQYTTGNVLAKRGYGNGKGIGGTTVAGLAIGGIGVDFRLSDKLDFRFEITNKGIDNDLLDTWKSNFPYDVYNHLTLGLVYKLGQRGGDSQIPDHSAGDQDGGDFWSNMPQKPQEKKDVTDNIQLTPVIEVPTEAETQVAEPEIIIVETPAIIIEPIQPGVPSNEFRVQIFAANKPFSKSTLSRRFRISESEIVEDRFQQFYIYSVGSFSTMEEAMAMRDKLRRENGVSDAFVTIWENGQRVGPRFK